MEKKEYNGMVEMEKASEKKKIILVPKLNTEGGSHACLLFPCLWKLNLHVLLLFFVFTKVVSQ